MPKTPHSVAPLIRDHMDTSTKLQIGLALASIIVFLVFILLGFVAALQYDEKNLFLLSIILGLAALFGTYSIGKRVLTKKLPQRNRDNVFSAFEPFIQKISNAGFDAAVNHSLALIRVSLSLADSHSEVFPIIDESMRVYLTRLHQIADARNQVGNNTELRNQFAHLQDSLEHHMRQTQKGMVTQQEHESLDKQVSSIQSRLDRVETLHRVALQITKDLARLRFSCEEFLAGHYSPEEARKQSRKLLQDQLEREKRLAPEIQRLGLF